VQHYAPVFSSMGLFSAMWDHFLAILSRFQQYGPVFSNVGPFFSSIVLFSAV
jgi:hypothetical protein